MQTRRYSLNYDPRLLWLPHLALLAVVLGGPCLPRLHNEGIQGGRVSSAQQQEQQHDWSKKGMRLSVCVRVCVCVCVCACMCVCACASVQAIVCNVHAISHVCPM